MIEYGRDFPDPPDVDQDGVIPTPRRGEVTTLADVVPERLAWLWPGRLPAGKLVTLDGDPALGKSTVAVDWAARISTGTPWPDGAPCAVGDVLILSAEDGLADTIRPRLDAAGGDPKRVHALTAVRTVDDGKVTERPPTLADVEVIREAITDTAAVLLVIDVLMAYLPSRADAHRDQDVRAVLHQIGAVADATGCTVLSLRHLNKSGGGSPLYRGGGSIGIVGAARAGFLVAPDPDDPDVRVLAGVKSNLSQMPDSLSYRLVPVPSSDAARVEWLGTSKRSAGDLLSAGDPADRTERDEVSGWLRDYLTMFDRAPSKDVKLAARKVGYSERTVKRAAQDMRVTVRSEGFPRVTYWSLPSEASQATPPRAQNRGPTGLTGPTGPDLQKQDASGSVDSQSGQWGQPDGADPTGADVLPFRWRGSGDLA